MNKIPKEQYLIRVQRCAAGKHKFRENSYGISWCTNCGLISNKPATLLLEDDKICII